MRLRQKNELTCAGQLERAESLAVEIEAAIISYNSTKLKCNEIAYVEKHGNAFKTATTKLAQKRVFNTSFMSEMFYIYLFIFTFPHKLIIGFLVKNGIYFTAFQQLPF